MEDVARAILSVIGNETALNRAFNLAPLPAVTYESFADALLAADEQYEQMLMGSLVNTFVTYYSLENITILSDGEYCVSQRNIYDAPLSFFYL